MDKLIEILNKIKSDIDYNNEKALVDDGILDSLDVATLVSELSSKFNIVIKLNDLIPDNFNSVEAMMALVNRLQEK